MKPVQPAGWPGQNLPLLTREQAPQHRNVILEPSPTSWAITASTGVKPGGGESPPTPPGSAYCFNWGKNRSCSRKREYEKKKKKA